MVSNCNVAKLKHGGVVPQYFYLDSKVFTVPIDRILGVKNAEILVHL